MKSIALGLLFVCGALFLIFLGVLMGLPGSAGGMENPAGSGVTAVRPVR